jgi:Protein of unknown function (DUF3108)/Tetratricopeptide repeat
MKTFLIALMLALVHGVMQAEPGLPSELLEKGIYTEETKGDLDVAITIYQQLINEAKTNQSLAAQAQFRLAQCYLKKNRTADATAAFARLVREYPAETELIAKAREYLPSSLTLEPAPWVDGERMILNLTLASGLDIGTVEYRAILIDAGGRRLWRVGARMSAGAQSVSSVDAEAESFRPLVSSWKHSLLGEVSAVFQPGEIQVQRSGAAEPLVIHSDEPVFDNEEAMHLMRRLPLQPGYKTKIPVITTLGGGMLLSVDLEVTAKETLEVSAGTFDCFKVHLGLINQDFWFSADSHRYLVKFEGGGAIGQLASIAQRRSDEPISFRDDELGISFTAPADWLVHRYKSGQPKKQSLIRTFDPMADSEDGGLRLFATDSLSPAARQSARAWAESRLRDYQDAKVRPDSWKSCYVDGRPGVSCVLDIKEGDKQFTCYGVHVLGPKTSEFFVMTSTPDKFDALKAAFDSIVASYRSGVPRH